MLATAFEEGAIRTNPAARVRIAQRVDEDAGEVDRPDPAVVIVEALGPGDSPSVDR
jgi:hypothetical protein